MSKYTKQQIKDIIQVFKNCDKAGFDTVYDKVLNNMVVMLEQNNSGFDRFDFYYEVRLNNGD